MSQPIKRREFIGTMGAGAAALGMSCTQSLETDPEPKKRPNILWITCEDISPDLSCYGVPEVSTPNLDRLATQGALYSRAFAHAGVCAPARSGLITSMYPSSIGSNNMRTANGSGKFDFYPDTLPRFGYEVVPPPEVKCFTEYLRAEGYYCTNRTKTDYQFQPPITAWDRIIPFNQGGADWRGREEGQPFFSVINFTNTHESQIRVPAGKKSDRDLASITLPPYYPDTPLVRNDYACYLDNIEAMDTMAQELLDWLEEDGLAEDTVVFFYGDHGRGLPRAKRWLYDSGTLVPLIIRWPGEIDPGTVNEELVSFIDFGATVLSIAGVEVPDYMQGEPFLGDQAAASREYVFGARDRMDTAYDNIRMVRDKRYKYLRNYMPEKTYAQEIAYMDMMPTMREMRRLNAEGKLKGPEKLFFRETKPLEELYDTVEDPHEINNLADSAEHRDILEKLRKVHEDWMIETGDKGHISEPDLVESMWPGGVQPVTAEPSFISSVGPNDTLNIKLKCPTEGASIAYTTDAGDDAHWKLYSRELNLSGPADLRVRAIRIGFKESPEATFTLK
ncbi:sulfatase-like hydrolase/transferase [Candidatus Latescibacterota bacterium]